MLTPAFAGNCAAVTGTLVGELLERNGQHVERPRVEGDPRRVQHVASEAQRIEYRSLRPALDDPRDAPIGQAPQPYLSASIEAKEQRARARSSARTRAVPDGSGEPERQKSYARIQAQKTGSGPRTRLRAACTSRATCEPAVPTRDQTCGRHLT
jgi:hypothetical protein